MLFRSKADLAAVKDSADLEEVASVDSKIYSETYSVLALEADSEVLHLEEEDQNVVQT